MTVRLTSSRGARPSPGRGSSGLVVGIAIGVLGAAIADRIAARFWDRDVEFFRVVSNIASEEFVEEVDREKLLDDALRGMVQGLDRYSTYYGRAELVHLDRETSGEFRGIGVVFRSPTQEGQVLFPFPGNPAARAGVRIGDRFLEVAGQPVAGLEPGGLQALLQSSDGDDLELVVRGLDGEDRRLVVRPERVVDPTVRHARVLDEELGIAYLAILSFSRRTAAEFDEALEALGEDDVRGLVVDLRSNPGGILDAAVDVANRFIAEGPIVVTQTRNERQVTEAVADRARLHELPLVLLVDEGSASASEVLAGALQDHAAAAVVGEPTYGKGTVQTLTRIDGDRAVVKLTTAFYFTPAGRRIERVEEGSHGIVPDYVLGIEEDERREIHRFLASYTPPLDLIPEIEAWERVEGVEVLPRHPDDTQLAAAVALLSGREPDGVVRAH